MLTLGLLRQHRLFFSIGFRRARTAGLLMLAESIGSELHPFEAPLQVVALVVSFLEIGFKLLHLGAKLADDLLVLRSHGIGRRRRPHLWGRRAFPPGQVFLKLLERFAQSADFAAFG